MATSVAVSKRTAVLEAALDLFHSHGYGATPVPAIAEAAGVAVGTIYRFFPGKEALVNELYREGKRRMAALLPTEAELAGLDTRTGFARWWSGLWDFLAADPEWLQFLETHHHAPYLDDESRAVAAALDDAAAAFIRRGQRVGDIRPGPPPELVALAFGAFVGLVRAGQAQPRRRQATEDAVWALLAAPIG